MDVGLSATHTGSHVRRLASKYSEEASTTRIMDPASAAVGIYRFSPIHELRWGATSSCINAVHYRVARRASSSRRPFKAKIRRNDRLTLVVVLYTPAHMAHKFSPATANWITSHGWKHGQRCTRKIMLPTLRTNSSRLKDESQERKRKERWNGVGDIYLETIAKFTFKFRYQVKWFRKSSSLVTRKKKRKRNKTYIYIYIYISTNYFFARKRENFIFKTNEDDYWDNSKNLRQSYLTKNKKKKDPATGKEEWNNFFHLHKQAIYI